MEYLKPFRRWCAMDRKELLLKLCQELYDAVDYLYGDSSGLRAHLGESLMWFGSMFSKIGWILVWGEEQDREKMFKVIEDTFRKLKEHRLRCSLEEWLCFKLQDIEDEMNKRIQPPQDLELNPEPTKQEEDELPF
jgi:hypothetical protein